MKLYLLLIITVVASCFECRAQKQHRVGFTSINQVGILEGDNGSAFQLQTINGVKYRSWSAGIGVGLDYYYLRSIPLFLDLRRNLWNKTNTPFIYADGGLQFAWPTPGQKFSSGNGKYYNRPFFDVGIGYKSAIGKHNALLLSAGYTEKYVYEKMGTPVYYMYTDFYPSPAPTYIPDRYAYTLRRIAIKIGWEF